MLETEKFAFLDTNIFLHFQFFTEIPWNKVLQVKSITLVIPPIIPKELDKHKYNHASERLKERANKVTKKLAELLRAKTEVRPKVEVLFERIEPQNEFDKYHLSKESQDDYLIASILRFQEETGNSAILVTNDLSLMIKAQLLNIDVFELPEQYKNKAEENLDKKKIKKLETEIRELKNLSPKLKLSVSKCEKSSVKKITKGEKMKEIDRIKIEFPKYEVPELPKDFAKEQRKLFLKASGVDISRFLFPDEDKIELHLINGKVISVYPNEIKFYNSDLEKFYTEYGEYLNKKSTVIELRLRTIMFQVSLTNSGTLPAKDVKVSLTFPEKFQVTTNVENFSYPEEIKPPQLLNISNKNKSSNYFNNYLFNPPIPNFKLKNKLDEIKIENIENRVSAEFQFIKINHGYSIESPKILYITFPKNHIIKPFQIQYKITAENIPQAIEGKLNVKIDK